MFVNESPVSAVGGLRSSWLQLHFDWDVIIPSTKASNYCIHMKALSQAEKSTNTATPRAKKAFSFCLKDRLIYKKSTKNRFPADDLSHLKRILFLDPKWCFFPLTTHLLIHVERIPHTHTRSHFFLFVRKRSISRQSATNFGTVKGSVKRRCVNDTSESFRGSFILSTPLLCLMDLVYF